MSAPSDPTSRTTIPGAVPAPRTEADEPELFATEMGSRSASWK
jgi:hypothetical protein